MSVALKRMREGVVVDLFDVLSRSLSGGSGGRNEKLGIFGLRPPFELGT
jgi:hypothetical protein